MKSRQAERSDAATGRPGSSVVPKVLAALALAGALQACATGPSASPGAAPAAEAAADQVAAPAAGGGAAAADPDPPPTRPDAERIAELEAIYRERAEEVLRNYHEGDVRFMTGMIGHHAQALLMCSFAPGNDASADMQTMCERIISSQRDEIDLMQRWLRDRGLEVPEVHIADGALMIHGPAHAHHMPGMLSPEQVDELRSARGREFDRLFLVYMIQHHEGAVTMVDELFATDGAAQGDDLVFRLASDIQADQTSEIRRMESMLEAMPPSGAAAPTPYQDRVK